MKIHENYENPWKLEKSMKIRKIDKNYENPWKSQNKTKIMKIRENHKNWQKLWKSVKITKYDKIWSKLWKFGQDEIENSLKPRFWTLVAGILFPYKIKRKILKNSVCFDRKFNRQFSIGKMAKKA